MMKFPFVRDKATTLEDEVRAALPIAGSLEDYAPQGDQGSKEATDNA